MRNENVDQLNTDLLTSAIRLNRWTGIASVFVYVVAVLYAIGAALSAAILIASGVQDSDPAKAGIGFGVLVVGLLATALFFILAMIPIQWARTYAIDKTRSAYAAL